MTVHKRARRAADEQRIGDEEAELRRLEGGGERPLLPSQLHWPGASLGAAQASPVHLVCLAVLIALIAAICGEVERAEALRRGRQPDRKRARLQFSEFVSHMTDKEFLRYYRIPRRRAESDVTASPQSFADLVVAITPPPEELAKQRASARESSGGFIEYELRLSMALRYLAGGSYLDIMYLHGVGKSAFYKHLWPTLGAIDKALPEFSLETDVHNLERCRHLAAGFARKTDGHIRGAIAALDGIIFKVERPATVNTKEVVNPNKFNCRKGFPGVSCQAACDADRRITFVSIDHAASCHDSRAWRTALTSKGTRMVDEIASSTVIPQCDDSPELAASFRSHPYGFFILADDAYPHSDTMCVPWRSIRDRPYRDSFNHQQSRGRINIECAFGMLNRKFLVLSRPMMSSITHVRTIVRASAKLHNLCRSSAAAAKSETGIYASDYTGDRDPALLHSTDERGVRGTADFARHLSSGTRDPDTGRRTQESPDTAWDDDDIPDDLVPNRTDLEGGPRQKLTNDLAADCILRPDPFLIAQRMLTAKRARMQR